MTHQIKTSKTKLIPIAETSTKYCNQIYSCNSLLLCDRPCDFVAPFCETKIWPGKLISSLFHSCKNYFANILVPFGNKIAVYCEGAIKFLCQERLQWSTGNSGAKIFMNLKSICTNFIQNFKSYTRKKSYWNLTNGFCTYLMCIVWIEKINKKLNSNDSFLRAEQGSAINFCKLCRICSIVLKVGLSEKHT